MAKRSASPSADYPPVAWPPPVRRCRDPREIQDWIEHPNASWPRLDDATVAWFASELSVLDLDLLMTLFQRSQAQESTIITVLLHNRRLRSEIWDSILLANWRSDPGQKGAILLQLARALTATRIVTPAGAFARAVLDPNGERPGARADLLTLAVLRMPDLTPADLIELAGRDVIQSSDASGLLNHPAANREVVEAVIGRFGITGPIVGALLRFPDCRSDPRFREALLAHAGSRGCAALEAALHIAADEVDRAFWAEAIARDVTPSYAESLLRAYASPALLTALCGSTHRPTRELALRLIGPPAEDPPRPTSESDHHSPRR